MNIIPTPKKVYLTSEEDYHVIFQASVCKNKEFMDAIHSFCAYVKKIYSINVIEKEDGFIHIEKEPQMAFEEYKIIIRKNAISIYASDAVGVNHAFATIIQLMERNAEKIILPEVIIEDKPDASYRGLMVDLARSWHPFSYLLSYVDMCYFYKVSVLHLHFTDDESYTLPSKIYPQLSTEGRMYTVQEIEELVIYAQARGVQLMPEIDVPGHSRCFREKYGELFGTKGVICQHKGSIEAMKTLFAELCDMFPYSKYIHIGGDEVSSKMEWTRCPQCLEYAKDLGLDTDTMSKETLAQNMYANFIM